jgi:hypothetical protein
VYCSPGWLFGHGRARGKAVYNRLHVKQLSVAAYQARCILYAGQQPRFGQEIHQ